MLSISIITVCKNAQDVIEKTMQSVFSQTYPGIEYIIVDGNSTDNTLKIIDQYSDKISTIISEPDKGIYDAMNKGIKAATGDVLYFLNADDTLFDKNTIASIAEQFSSSQGLLVYGKCQYENIPIDMTDRFFDRKTIFNNKMDVAEHTAPQQCFFYHQKAFELIGNFDPGFQISGDIDWLLRFLDHGLPAKFIDHFVCSCPLGGVSFKSHIKERIRAFKNNMNLWEFNQYAFFAFTRHLSRSLRPDTPIKPIGETTVCFWPGREAEYTRNRVMLKAMKAADLSVIDCSPNIKNPLRYIQSFIKFLFSYRQADIVVIGFWGHCLVPIARLFTKKPIIFDSFVSTYMTMCLDRQKFKPNGVMASLAKFIDRQACQAADIVLCDTQEHINFFAKTYNIETKKFIRLWVGSDESVMRPYEDIQQQRNLIHFHGEYQPLHGIKTIIQAARLLPEYRFRLIGKGEERKSCETLTKNLNAANVSFDDPVSYEKLAEKIAEASICLGIFGNTIKTQTVIPHKIFEALAIGKPVVTANTPATRELLMDRDNAILCEANNPEDLAKSIKLLLNDEDLRKNIARSGHKTFVDQCSATVLGKKMKELINALTGM